MITLGIALRKSVVAQKRPVITEHDFFLILKKLMESSEYEGEPIRLTKRIATRDFYRKRARELLKARYLRPDEDFYPPNEREGSHCRVFRVSDIPDGSAEDITALVDPFCYISHLSAMQRHGLTNRSPAELHITTPATELWRKLRDELAVKNYGSLPAPVDKAGLPSLSPQESTQVKLEHIKFPSRLRGRPIVGHTTKYPVETRPIRGSFARVAAVGDVFMQMLDSPDACGGMTHVLEVWANEARPYIEDILKAAGREAQSGIVKVRAGYLLETLYSVKDPRIADLQKFAQRGSSRKLDPAQPYLSTYSEKWMLSLNAESEYLPPNPKS